MAIRILSDENITGSFEVSGKVGIGTAPTSRNLSVFRDTAGSVANFLHYTDASNFAGLYIGVSQSSQTVSLNASGSSGGNFEMQCGNATALSLTSSNATFAGNITGVRGFFNSGATNVVATFTSTDGTATLQCADPTGNVEFGASGNNFVVQPAGGVAQLTVGASSSTFAGQVSVGNYAIPSDHQFQIAHLGQSYARFGLTNSQTGNGSSDGLKFQMENLNSIIKNQENGSLAFGTNGRETDLYINSSGSINIGSRRAALPSTFGYSSSYKVLILGSSGANYQTDAVTLSLGVDVSGNSSGSFNGNGREIIIRNEGAFISPNAANNGYNTILSWNSSGQPYFNQNVGIGTTSPDAKLELKKETTWGTLDNQVIYINNTGTGGNTGLLHDMGSITWRSGNVNTAAISGIRNTPGSGNNVDLRFTTATQSGGQQTSMTILSGGNVGIGVTDPEKKLEVKSDTTYDGIMIDVLSAPEITFRDRGNSDTRIGTGRHQLDGFHIDTYSGNALFIKGSNRFVGIGTTTPEQILHVEGRGVFDGGTSSDILQIRNDNGGGVFGMTSNLFALDLASASSFRIRQGSSVPFYLKSDGNLGIGTTNPTLPLSVNGPASMGDGERLSMGILDINSGATPSQIKILTNIPFASGNADFTVKIEGFIYGSGTMVSLLIGWHYYNSQPWSRNCLSNGSWAPTITLGASNGAGGGFMEIHLSSPGYWPKFYVKNVYSSFYKDAYSDGWSWSDAALSGTTYSVPYKAINDGTSSDYRLKEDLQDFAGLDMVSKIPVYDFKWKDNESRSYGVMAHELQEVLPEAVEGEKDEPIMQWVDYRKVVPLLVKSIQELKAEIELLKNK
jgi:hypothetical protein